MMDNDTRLLYEAYAKKHALTDISMGVPDGGRDKYFSVLNAAEADAPDDEAAQDETIAKINTTVFELIDRVLDMLDTDSDDEELRGLSSTWDNISKPTHLDAFLALFIRKAIHIVLPNLAPHSSLNPGGKGYAAKDLWAARAYRYAILPALELDAGGNLQPKPEHIRKPSLVRAKQKIAGEIQDAKPQPQTPAKFNVNTEYEVHEINRADLEDDIKELYDRLPNPGEPWPGKEIYEKLKESRKFIDMSNQTDMQILRGLNTLVQVGALALARPEPDSPDEVSDVRDIDVPDDPNRASQADRDASDYFTKHMGHGLGSGSMSDY